MPSSRRSSIPVPLIEARTGTQRGLRRTPVVSRDRAVGSCSHAAHAPGRRAWCVSGTAGPGAPRWGGRGGRKGKAIQLGQGYRQPRWWRPPKPRPRPNRRRKRRVKQAIMASLDTGGQVSAAPGAEADIVIRVLQESLRKAILRAEAAEAKLLAPRVELQTQPAQTKYSVLQPHYRGFPKPQYSSPVDKREARLMRRAKHRVEKHEAHLMHKAERKIAASQAGLYCITAKLGRSTTRANEANARVNKAEHTLDEVNEKLRKTQSKLAKAKQQQQSPQQHPPQQQPPQPKKRKNARRKKSQVSSSDSEDEVMFPAYATPLAPLQSPGPLAQPPRQQQWPAPLWTQLQQWRERALH